MFLFFLVTQVVTDFIRIQHFISLFFLFISCFCALKIITHRNISITATLHICILVCFIIFFLLCPSAKRFFSFIEHHCQESSALFSFFIIIIIFQLHVKQFHAHNVEKTYNKNKENTEKHNRRDKKRVSTIFAENLLHYSLHALERKQHFQSSLYFDLSAAISGKQFKC